MLQTFILTDIRGVYPWYLAQRSIAVSDWLCQCFNDTGAVYDALTSEIVTPQVT